MRKLCGRQSSHVGFMLRWAAFIEINGNLPPWLCPGIIITSLWQTPWKKNCSWGHSKVMKRWKKYMYIYLYLRFYLCVIKFPRFHQGLLPSDTSVTHSVRQTCCFALIWFEISLSKHHTFLIKLQVLKTFFFFFNRLWMLCKSLSQWISTGIKGTFKLILLLYLPC